MPKRSLEVVQWKGESGRWAPPPQRKCFHATSLCAVQASHGDGEGGVGGGSMPEHPLGGKKVAGTILVSPGERMKQPVMGKDPCLNPGVLLLGQSRQHRPRSSGRVRGWAGKPLLCMQKVAGSIPAAPVRRTRLELAGETSACEPGERQLPA